MKKIIRIIAGILFFALGIFFAVTATAIWLQGQALHIGFGALCGCLGFFIVGFMTIGEANWRDIADIITGMWWL